MSSGMMTFLGIFSGVIATVQFSLPSDTPTWLQATLAAISGGLAVYLGKTNKGTQP